MDDKMESTLRESQLASLGKLLAGYSHELKNHLAIINESSGLMDDLLEMAESEDNQTRQRFKKIIATIADRISQANTVTRHLNSLGHRMDMATSVFNVNDLLIEELALVDRFARLKSISLETNLQKELPSVSNNPSLLQFIVFSLVFECIEKLANGGVIHVSSQKQDEDIELNIEAIGAGDNTTVPDDSDKMPTIIEFAAEKMDIGLKRSSPEADHLKITATLPAE